MFWVKGGSGKHFNFLASGGNTALGVEFTTATNLQIAGTHDFTVTDVSTGTAWFFFDITRSGTTITVRQNKVSKGTATASDTFGGANTDFKINTPNGAINKFFDSRCYAVLISEAALDDYYDNVINDEGYLYLPYG